MEKIVSMEEKSMERQVEKLLADLDEYEKQLEEVRSELDDSERAIKAELRSRAQLYPAP